LQLPNLSNITNSQSLYLTLACSFARTNQNSFYAVYSINGNFSHRVGKYNVGVCTQYSTYV